MSQPDFFKKSIKSLISGSIAQFNNTVSPVACVAAMIAFSVAPTEIFGNLIFSPFKPSVALA